MKVYHSLEDFKKLNNAIVTTGTFDGVHIGHQAILSRVVEFAKKEKGESVLITFFPHPRMVLQKDLKIKLLNTISEKIDLLGKTGIDHLLIYPFTKEFSKMSSTEFVRDILVNKIGTKKLVIGYDHQFGKNREGSFENLSELSKIYDFEVEEISAQDINNISVSSTKIRDAITKDGNMKTAMKFLGSSFQLSGVVTTGNKIGTKIGFPTANISIEEDYKLIPKDGAYVVSISIDNTQYYGMLNIGNRPTVEGENRTIEVHIFDFDHQIYNREVKILFIDRLRDEKKFSGIDTLKKQLEIDLINSKNIISNLA